MELHAEAPQPSPTCFVSGARGSAHSRRDSGILGDLAGQARLQLGFLRPRSQLQAVPQKAGAEENFAGFCSDSVR